MNIVVVALFIAAWFGCGYLAAGWGYADYYYSFHYLRKDPAERQRWKAQHISFGVFGPVAVAIVYPLTGFAYHGWLKPGADPLNAAKQP